MTQTRPTWFVFKIILMSFIFFYMGEAMGHTRTTPTPQVILPETRFEFPPVFEGQPVRHDFLIQNRGDAPLDILDVRTD